MSDYPEWCNRGHKVIIDAYWEVRSVKGVQKKLHYKSPSYVRKIIAQYRESLSGEAG